MAAKDGAYADAIARGHTTMLLVTETSGGMAPALITLLQTMGRAVKLDSANDTTIYGLGRMSTKSFFLHHLGAISSAIVMADARTIVREASSMSIQLTTTTTTHPAPARARATQASPQSPTE